ncbi:MAG: ABC transporter substrate-binding protein [Vicinamibacterales bacterium]|mgnify:CR=1 FL=1|jgi:ribose transport system substrate-binding protein
MKKISIAVIAASLAIAAGCGSDDSENSSSTEPAIGSLPAGTDGVDTTDEASGKGLDMTLVLGTLGDDFYKAIECGAKLEAEATGVNLDIQAPTAFDASLQIPIVNAIAATDPDAVIIAPNDSDALFEPLKSIVDAGSELVLVDTNLSDTTLAAGHIGSDYLLYGEQGAQEIAKLIGETGKVLAIFAPPGVSTNDLGREGFSAAMEAFPDIEVLEFEFSSGEAGKSAEIVSAVLAANPDLAGVFTFNGGDAPGVVTALTEAGVAESVRFVSGDAQPFQVEMLRAGEVQALIVQQARTMGTLSIQYAIDAINDVDVPAETALPTIVATLDNLEDPEVANNLYQGC